MVMKQLLTPLEVKRLPTSPARLWRVGPRGLYVKVNETGTKSWVFRWMSGGKIRSMGMGGVDSVPLALVREKVASFRNAMAGVVQPDGTVVRIDPLAERRKFDEQKKFTFGGAAERWYGKLHERIHVDKTLRDAVSLVERNCKPIWGHPIRDVRTEDVKRILSPLYPAKFRTVVRLARYMAEIFDRAMADGWLPRQPNPADRKALDIAVPKGLTTKHRKAIDYREAPALAHDLHRLDDMTSRALLLCLLTATRTDEVRESRWDEFDLDSGLWTIPAARMLKGKRDHKVFLSEPAIELLASLPRGHEYVFCGAGGRVIGAHAMLDRLRQLRGGIDVHGFRASFKTWTENCTSFRWEAAEMCLAHAVGNTTERSYRREGYDEERRKIMQAWADYLDGRAADVVMLKRGA
jgi:integrase